MRSYSLLLWFLLLVGGVFGGDEVSVTTEGSVTLNTGLTEIKEKEKLQWKINNEIIAEIDRETDKSFVAETFGDRLKLNEKTGSLTIINLRTTDSTVYELQIKGREKKNKKFNVTVHETDVVKSVSVMEGDTVTLHTGVTEIQRDDQILWKFGDQDLNGTVDQNNQTGDLTIRNIRRDQIGDYKMEINKISWIFHRKFCISLKDEMKNVSVKEGESVTLRTGLIEIQGYDLILWKFGDDVIGNINKGTNQFSVYDSKDKRFNDRLQLNEKSGSLTISDSKTTDSGDYHLNMDSSSYSLQRTISVTVKGVKSVSVMEGDTVTLHTGFIKKQSDELIQWKFGGQVIPTDGLNGGSYLNDQTGEITIRNIQSNQSGVYEVEINSSSLILHRKLHITVTDEMKTVSVTEGEPIILYTGLIEIWGTYLIMWKFEDHLIAEINKETNQFLSHDGSAGGRFKGRLQPSEQSGSLTIRGSRTTDSGDYHLNMSSSSHTVQRNISVTVSGSGLSSGTIAWIVVVVLLLVLVAFVICYHRKICKLKGCRDLVKNGTNDPLKTGTDGSDNL